jgi:hypothetical protein
MHFIASNLVLKTTGCFSFMVIGFAERQMSKMGINAFHNVFLFDAALPRGK